MTISIFNMLLRSGWDYLGGKNRESNSNKKVLRIKLNVIHL